jgi:hypothetical protein
MQRAIQLSQIGIKPSLSGGDLLGPTEQEAARAAKLQDFEAQERIKARFNPPSAAKPDYKPVIIDGRETYLTPEEIRARGGVTPAARRRPTTGQERAALAFYQRAEQANQVAAPLEEGISKMGLGGQLQLEHAPNIMQSGSNQRYRQAQRAFTEARLRKESGAAIPQGEYDNDARTYFAQPGDTPAVIAQKQQARKQVLEGLALSTGGAWEEYYGEPREPGAAGATIGTTIRLQAPDGTVREVPADQAQHFIGKGAKVVQ